MKAPMSLAPRLSDGDVHFVERCILPIRRPVLRGLPAELVRAADEVPAIGSFPQRLCVICVRMLDAEAAAWRQREVDRARLVQAVLGADTAAEKRTLLAESVTRCTDDAALRRRRLRALEHDLDLEGVLDLEATVLARDGQRIQGLLDVLGALGPSACAPEPASARQVCPVVRVLLTMTGPPFWDGLRADALASIARVWHPDAASELRDDLAAVTAMAADEGDDPFVRAAAYEVWHLADPQAAKIGIFDCLRNVGAGDALLLRRRLVMLAQDGRLGPIEALPVAKDPSEHVRQEWARSLATSEGVPALVQLGMLMEEDPSPRVRGLAAVVFEARARHDDVAARAFEASVERALTSETHPLVLRSLLEALVAGAEEGVGQRHVTRLEQFAARTGSSELALLAASVLLELEVQSDETLQRARALLQARAQKTAEGQTAPIDLAGLADDAQLERALMTGAVDDFQWALRRTRRGLFLVRGEPRRRRAWRTFFELVRPRPDKRQDTLHTVGRRDRAEVVVPPRGLAEVTQTKVPGERRVVSRLGHWAPFLPRVDDFLEAAELGKTRRILSRAGAVHITPPARWFARLRARAALIRGYARFATAREVSLDADEQVARARYLDDLRALGFVVRFEPLRGRVRDHSFTLSLREVAPFFRAVDLPTAAPLVPVLFDSPLGYLLEDGGNLPAHLVFVVALLLFWLLTQSMRQRGHIGSLVSAIPWVIGGWGTRGKSGTERLKAALFQGLGLDVWVKTTGCEAMFIHGIPTRPALEVFLYRPYDKPTIWEQVRVVEMSQQAGAQVFLWECMALNPRYVEVLAHEWMRPSISTITNAYPDHEDVQGPSGEDVARVIATFTPHRGLCFTAEDQMLPILREQARNVGAELRIVTPTEADLLPVELLERYPYQEHPRNILLVARMAEHLGVPWDRAVVAMADWVVPDLGVLKTYPEIAHRTRRLRFTNGMSANERAGTLSNWQRLGLYQHDDPGESIVTVINNRWDRIPRSWVFAKIVVEDISASAHLCIGSNLEGLRRFIIEALDAWLPTQRLAGSGDPSAPETQARRVEAFDRFFGRLKVPLSEGALRQALERALVAVGASRAEVQDALAGETLSDEQQCVETCLALLPPEARDTALGKETIRWVGLFLQRFNAMVAVRALLAEGGDVPEAERRAQHLYREMFLANVHVVADVQATGDQVIHQASSTVPPGQRVHLIGLQNIKGTGLDFVYRWLSIERVGQAIRELKDPRRRRDALVFLGSYAGYGLFDCRMAQEALAAQPESAVDEHATLAQRALSHLGALEANLAARLETSSSAGRFERFLGWLERWLDPLDSIYRAVAARKVQDAVAAYCISQNHAAEKMRAITSRDKGGWLFKSYQTWRKRRARETSGTDHEEGASQPPLALPSVEDPAP